MGLESITQHQSQVGNLLDLEMQKGVKADSRVLAISMLAQMALINILMSRISRAFAKDSTEELFRQNSICADSYTHSGHSFTKCAAGAITTAAGLGGMAGVYRANETMKSMAQFAGSVSQLPDTYAGYLNDHKQKDQHLQQAQLKVLEQQREDSRQMQQDARRMTEDNLRSLSDVNRMEHDAFLQAGS